MIILMVIYCFHFTTIYKQVTKKATTLYTSRLTAQQLSADWIFSLQPSQKSPRLSQNYRCDPHYALGEREGYILLIFTRFSQGDV